ncbi:MAG: tetratricopeptide repeat protein [Magnetococcales bacterium]|nr:tetratricopeptide repeat protein [Magnetococcales bacterium]
MATNVIKTLRQAVAHHQAGRARDAEGGYRAILRVDPAHPDAWHNLGVLAKQAGDPVTALTCFRNALASEPPGEPYWSSCLVALFEQGAHAEAETVARRMVGRYPEQGIGWKALGTALQLLGRGEEALVALRMAAERLPGDVETLTSMGVVAHGLGRWADAEAACREVLRWHPAHADAHADLGVALRKQGRLTEAGAAWRESLRIRPGHVTVLANLGFLLGELPSPVEEEACYREVLRIRPDHGEVGFALGVLLQNQRRFDEAEACYRALLRHHPTHAWAINNLGRVLQDRERHVEAEACYREALRYAPDFAEAHGNLGSLMQAWNRDVEAEACYREALRCQPDEAGVVRSFADHLCRQICAWEGLRESEAGILAGVRAGNEVVEPFPMLALSGTPMDQLRCARAYTRNWRIRADEGWSVAESGRIRLGYLSADFGEHPVGRLMAALCEAHSRERIAVLAYSCGPDDGSKTRQRIEAGCDGFADLRAFSDEDAARRIREDGVDILVDLQGFTRGARLAICSHRPAPVQVTGIGYCGTLGHPGLMDYLLGDPVSTPPEHASHFAETLALLPHSLLFGERSQPLAGTPTRAEAGLPDEGIVFCSFNTFYKLNPESFDIWCRLLQEAPGSILWLRQGSDTAMENLRREAARRGVPAERLRFAARTAGMAEHLARLSLADIALDTFPYNSHTTGVDALWSGVPLVTRIGETLVSRVGASLLHAVGLPELVASDWDGYCALALDLARNPERLGDVRRRLRESRLTHPLFDIDRYARDLERVYERMWRNWREGRKEMILPDGLGAGP